MKYLIRTLILPFVIGITIPFWILSMLKMWYNFIVYGGEWINYNKRVNKNTIMDVYETVAANHLNKEAK